MRTNKGIQTRIRAWPVSNQSSDSALASTTTPQSSSLDMKDVEITREPIELHKLLKFEGLTASGGQAKAMIAAGRVLLNGVLETQKRKKLVSGDCIEIGETKLTLRLVATPEQP